MCIANNDNYSKVLIKKIKIEFLLCLVAKQN